MTVAKKVRVMKYLIVKYGDVTLFGIRAGLKWDDLG